MTSVEPLIASEALRLILTAASTAVLTTFAFLVRNRRALLTYTVSHYRIGITATDPAFGDIRVTVGGEEMTNVYITNIEVMNRSIKDLKSLVLKTSAGANCSLLNGRAIIKDSIETLSLTQEYIAESGIEDPNSTPLQKQLQHNQRWYAVPVLNRGQSILITYLLNCGPSIEPFALASCQSAGIVLKQKSYEPPTTHVWGVPIKLAAYVGLIFLIAAIIVISLTIDSIWLATTLAAVIGACVVAPGAAAIRLYTSVRNFLVG